MMVDTNILVSVLLFLGERMNQMMEYIFTNHQLVLSSYVVGELKDVDVLITGDRDFEDVRVERPEIMTPVEFIKKYIDGK